MDAGKCANANQPGTYAPAPSLTSKPGEGSRGNALEIALDMSLLFAPKEYKKCEVTASWPFAALAQGGKLPILIASQE